MALCHLWKVLANRREMPEDWRIASVTPVFQKCKKADLGSYRLLSLTSIPRKMMEQLVLGRGHWKATFYNGSILKMKFTFSCVFNENFIVNFCLVDLNCFIFLSSDQANGNLISKLNKMFANP